MFCFNLFVQCARYFICLMKLLYAATKFWILIWTILFQESRILRYNLTELDKYFCTCDVISDLVYLNRMDCWNRELLEQYIEYLTDFKSNFLNLVCEIGRIHNEKYWKFSRIEYVRKIKHNQYRILYWNSLEWEILTVKNSNTDILMIKTIYIQESEVIWYIRMS